MGLLTTLGKIGTKTIPRLIPNTRPIALGAGLAGAAVAADVVFTGGEALVAPVAGNLGEAVGRGATATGAGLATGALDQALGSSLPGVPTTGGGDSSFIAIAIIGVVAFLVLRK